MPLGCCLTGATDGYVRSFLGAPGVVSPEKDCVIAAVSFESRGGVVRRFPVSRPADMPRTRDEGASLYRPPPRPLRRSSSYDISIKSIAARTVAWLRIPIPRLVRGAETWWRRRPATAQQ